MNTISLLKPSIKRFLRVFSLKNKSVLFSILIGASIFYIGIYYGMARFLGYVSKAPLLGDAFGVIIGGMLLSKLLEMIFMTMFFMLLFSGVISALSILYLDPELQTLMVSPQPLSRIFMSRFILLTFDSA